MSKKSVMQILCLRHGRTAYTGAPADLTIDGEMHVRQVATDAVLPWMKEHSIDVRNLKIYSSPAPRAHYTAQCIAEVIVEEKNLVPSLLPQADIGPAQQHDKGRAMRVYETLRADNRHVSYETEPDFQDSTIFETPGEVRARWYEFLARYIMYHFAPTVFVSHYEVLCNLVHDIFGIVATKDTELRHAEPIYLSVSEHDPENGLVLISGQFRNVHASALFSLWDNTLKRQ